MLDCQNVLSKAKPNFRCVHQCYSKKVVSKIIGILLSNAEEAYGRRTVMLLYVLPLHSLDMREF
jgi:hypothetical protein